MEVFDCSKYFNKTDVFKSISRDDLRSLHMTDAGRQGIFKPVTTDKGLSIKTALIALNGFAGDDYLQFFAEPNPMVRACLEHKSLIEKLPKVIDKYRAGVPALAGGTFYFTNFVKVYPPKAEFNKAESMDTLLKNCPEITALFRRYLREEIIGLIKDGCRVFICFGKSASDYFSDTFLIDVKAQCQVIGAVKSNSVRQCTIDNETVFVVSERHYAYYANATTGHLVHILAEHYNEK